MISGDKNVLIQGSEACARLELQRSQVEQLDVFVWPQIHAYRKIFVTAQKNKYDVITAQDPFWRGLLAWRVARRTGTKLNLQVHTDLSEQSFLRRALANFLLRHADSVRVVSEKIKEQVQGVIGNGIVHVLPVYVDIKRFQDLAHEPNSQKTMLWIGRFESEKDPLTAIRVLKEVRKSVRDTKLIMLGTGSLENILREEAKNLKVEFLGWQDPAPYLQTADVVICTSKHESWGASIVEALAAGVPVIAPDVGIAREAGAIIVARTDLARATIDVLTSGQRGELKMNLLNAEEWAKRWRETLT